jgi:histidine ammonia-lyase
MADQTVVLTGRDLTIDQVVQVARYGAKVALSAEARRRSADAHALLLEAAAEGVSVLVQPRLGFGPREVHLHRRSALTGQQEAIGRTPARHIPARRARRAGS